MMYTTTDGRTWSSMVSAYRHEAAINPNPELRRYYAEEAEKCGVTCKIPWDGKEYLDAI